MNQRKAGARFLESSLFALSSLVLYHAGVGIPFFLLPLQVVASRRGVRGFLTAAGLFFTVFLGIRLYPFAASGGYSRPDALVFVESATVLLLLGGLAGANILRQRRALYAIVGATLGAGIIAAPVLLWLSGNAAFTDSVRSLFNEVAKSLAAALGPTEGVAGSLLSPILDPVALQRLVETVLTHTLLVDYFVLLSFSWWAGQAAAARTVPWTARAPFRFSGFRLEGFWLWPLIISWALVLADLFLGLPGAWAAWNIGLVLLFLYGLQGMAILRFLFEKHGLPRLLWVLLVAGIVILAASPRAGLFVVVAVPVFGISENWIRYRVRRDAAPTGQS